MVALNLCRTLGASALQVVQVVNLFWCVGGSLRLRDALIQLGKALLTRLVVGLNLGSTDIKHLDHGIIGR